MAPGTLSSAPNPAAQLALGSGVSASASRKRKLSQVAGQELDGLPLTPQIPVPSRIKSRMREDVEKATALNNSILAPVDQATFESLNVKPWIVKSLQSMAIRRPTKIQKGCIPEVLKGRDCIGGSRTGSGKTVAFAVPILQKWAEDPIGIFAVVLTPTRYILFKYLISRMS
jgi:ATP-dependent RNA helicase DDX49/DBP8